MKKEHNLWELFWTFLKIGALTFGGGLAMMPIMRKEVVEKRNWVDDEDVLKILVISESTPGVFAINSATFIGYKIAKFKGSLLATLGVIIPSFIIISIISIFIIQFKEFKLVEYAFYGIQAGVAILIFRAALKLSRKIHFTLFSIMIMSASILISLFTEISVLYILLFSALLAIIFGYIESLKGAKTHDTGAS
jgi:chromate transporter